MRKHAFANGLATTVRPLSYVVWTALLTILGPAPAAPGGQAPQPLPPPTAEELARLEEILPDRLPQLPETPRRILIFSRCEGARHAVIPLAAKVFERLGEKTGAYGSVESTDMAAFAPDSLAGFDAVLLNNCTRLAFADEAHRRALLAFVRDGKGLIGTHAAADSFYTWPEGEALLGGQFDGHPWTARGTWAVKIDDPEHPLNAPFGGTGFSLRDEIYQMKGSYSRETHRVLLSLNMEDERTRGVDAAKIKRTDNDHPVAWIRPEGRGRVFYCSLGHNREVLLDPAVLRHYLAGIRYALGDLEADDAPRSLRAGVATRDPYGDLASGDYGKIGAARAAVEAEIRGADAAGRRAIEERLQDVLRADAATADGRDAACRLLRFVGSPASVPAVEPLLADERLCVPAARFLADLPAPEAEAALRRALETGPAGNRIHILNAFATRATDDALPLLASLADDRDPAIARTALLATGRIGTPRAAEALRGRAGRGPAAALLDASLECAQRCARNGDADAANRLYRTVLESGDGTDATVRAALTGLARGEGRAVLPEIFRYMTSGAPHAMAFAGSLLDIIPDLDASADLGPRLAGLPGEARIGVIEALGRRGEAEAFDLLRAQASSEDEAVRGAAFAALADACGARAVPILLAAALETPPTPGAADALAGMRGEDVDATLLDAARGLPADAWGPLPGILAARQCAEAVPLLLPRLNVGDGAARLETWKALGVLADASSVRAMLTALAAGADGAETDAAVDAIGRSLTRGGDAAAAVATAIDALAAAPAARRPAVVRILGRIGGPQALAAVADALKSPDASTRDAALRVAADWRTPDALPVLHTAITGADDPIHRVLAYRGYVKLLGAPTDRSAEETVALYREALELGPNATEKTAALAGLGRVADPAAVSLAAESAKDEALRAAAIKACLAAYGDLSAAGRPVARPALESLRALPADAALLRDVESALAGGAGPRNRPATDSGDFITEWRLAGPYGTDATPETDLFAAVFPPETGGDGVEWRPVKSVRNAAQGHPANLEALIGGQRRVAYVSVWVEAPEAGPARLELGSDDGVKVWLNGTPVHANNARRPVRPGADKVNVTLRPGPNALLIKVTQEGGHWGVCARVCARDGSPISGLRYSTEPPKQD